MELFVPKRRSVFIELNGETVATASAVKCVCVKERRAIRVFGEPEPVAWLERSPSYRLELSQLSGSGLSGPSLWEMQNFRLATVQDGVRTTYSGCEWQELTEQADAGDGFLAEHAVISARKRIREEEQL